MSANLWTPFAMAPRTTIALLLLLATLSPSQSGAGIPPAPPGNILYGLVNADRTLTVAAPGPVYDVIGDLTVAAGAELTIEPGVVFRFAAVSDFLGSGNYLDRVELVVHGVLTVSHVGGDSVRFESSAGGNAEWGEIRIESGGTADVSHAVIDRPRVACRILGEATIRNSRIIHNFAEPALYVAGNALMSDSDLSSHSIAIWSVGTMTIDGSFIHMSDGTGIRSSGTLLMTESQILDANLGIQGDAGSVNIERVRISGVRRGAELFNVTGSILACEIAGRTVLPDGGLRLGPSVSTSPPDSTNPDPTVVHGFARGVDAYGVLENVLAYDNEIGINLHNNPLVLYCTAAHNTRGIVAEADATILNCIAAMNTGAGIETGGDESRIDYTDSWGNVVNFAGTSSLAVGDHVSSFDPRFVDAAVDDFRLSAESLFLHFSPSGGQIGAYGPGVGGTVDVPRRSWTWGRLKGVYR